MSDIELSPDQTSAIETALGAIERYEPSLIMGRAGTGKTTTLKGLVDEIKRLGYPFKLVAFTNKAVDVIRKKLDVDEFAATTSHRLLYQTEMIIRIGELEFPNAVGKKILKELSEGVASCGLYDGLDDEEIALLDLEERIQPEYIDVGIPFDEKYKKQDKSFTLLECEKIVESERDKDNDYFDSIVVSMVDDLETAYDRIDYGQVAKTTIIKNPDPDCVIICDEVSMLPNEDKDQILANFQRVVFVGDYRQLPPVSGPDTIVELMASLPGSNQAELSTVFRSGDKILDMAERAEQGKSLGGVTIDLKAFTHHVNKGSKFLLPTNKAVYRANMAARRVSGQSGPPKSGEPLMMQRKAKAFIPSYVKGSYDLILKLRTTERGGMVKYDAWPTKEGEGGKPGKIDDKFGNRREIRNARIMSMPKDEFESTLFFVKEYVHLQKNTEIFQNMPAFKYSRSDDSDAVTCIPLEHEGVTVYLPSIAFWALSFEEWERARADGSMVCFFSYAMTVHKSQGSEYESVVTQPKNWGEDKERLNYTAITRAKKECVIARSFKL